MRLAKMRARAGKYTVSWRWLLVLCIASCCVGSLIANGMWDVNGDVDEFLTRRKLKSGELNCDTRPNGDQSNRLSEASTTNLTIENLNKTILSMERELATVQASRPSSTNRSQILGKPFGDVSDDGRRKAFAVIGINTAFSSRKRRDSVRETWMPQGDELKKLEEEKGIVIRFVIGHSATPGGILDRAIEAEAEQHKDFLVLDHAEGYMELSAKTKIYFSTAFAKWDAEFYVKVDDDIHVNIHTLVTTLARHRSRPLVYIGCMKSGPVLSQKGVKYHEPEFWRFGDKGNKYFRHATGQIYAISKDLASYISNNQQILHKYANEDVSLGSWLIGLDVEHIDDRSLCCGTPPDCEWKALSGNVCVASFDWACSGICNSVDRIMEVHQRCSEPEGAIWSLSF